MLVNPIVVVFVCTFKECSKFTTPYFWWFFFSLWFKVEIEWCLLLEICTMGGIFFSPKMFFRQIPKFRNLSIFTLIFQEEVEKKILHCAEGWKLGKVPDLALLDYIVFVLDFFDRVALTGHWHQLFLVDF